MRLTATEIKEAYFDEIEVTIKCPYCGAYGCDVAFDFNDPNNTEIRQCESCERHFGYRLELTTTATYFSCEILDDQDNHHRVEGVSYE